MPDLVLNGESLHNNLGQENSDNKSPISSHDNDRVASENDENGPPFKKRKVESGINQKSSPRPISPPWKRVVADGPTSFVENGRRKSGRTNAIPLELQPHSNKRQTRAAFDKKLEQHHKNVKPLYKPPPRKNHVDSKPSPAMSEGKRGPGRPPKSRPSEQKLVKSEPDTKTKPRSSSTSRNLHRTPTKSPRFADQAQQRSRRSFSSMRRVKEEQNLLPNGFHEVDTNDSGEDTTSSSSLSSISSGPPLTLQKVTFRVRLPKPSVATPANIPPPKKFGSFEEFLEKDENEPILGQDRLTDEQVQSEASIRLRVRKAQRSGQLASSTNLQTSSARSTEPKRQYAHYDHLLAHVGHFRTLLRAERKDHKKRAEIIAHEAKKYVEDKLKKNKVKTKEEIEQEKFEYCRQLYRMVVKDVQKLWIAVGLEVEGMRLKEYEEQQQAKMKGHLARVLDRTDQMLNRNADLDDSMLDSDEIEDSSDNVEDELSEDSEEISESESDLGSNSEPDDPDAEMSLEELKQKYGNIPELENAQSDIGEETDTQRMDDEVDTTADTEDSDPETEMDSEFDTEESDEDESGEEAEDEDEQGGLWSLFSKKEIADMTVSSDKDDTNNEVEEENHSVVPTPAESGQKLLIEELDEANVMEDVIPSEVPEKVQVATEEDVTQPLVNQSVLSKNVTTEVVQNAVLMPRTPVSLEERASREPSTQASPRTSATKASEPESVSSVDLQQDPNGTAVTAMHSSNIKTPVPSLLRGTLREYQHEGLDWLADLYANGRSGILADEMGLGKTIQSISVLAHLAEVHEVWGPHLIVVPTSVMLNWEMEFKKFLPGFKILTYYGSLEERKQKRRGWMADDSFNVCITSYQLVLQDANSFKRRRWHYMILDEAHNIKNFRSERWQTMMTFNTRARLLLTGTPLQNNLTELWSLLFFLHYGQETEDEDDAFAGLKEWSEWFKRPVESILEHGRQVLDEEDKEQVAKLHKVIRPFLLRRLKADVEKQMPLKYEHVEICRLSKRQRQLYDGFMSRAQTKETLASGNYLSIINALMQLRKVCNHPDLFETRPINTSLALPRSVAADYEISDLLVKKRLMESPLDELDLDFLQLSPISNENVTMIEFYETSKKHAYNQFKALRDNQWRRTARDLIWHGEERGELLSSLENAGRKARLQELDRLMYYEAYRHHQHPIYGRGLIDRLCVDTTYDKLSRLTGCKVMTRSWEREEPVSALTMVHSIRTRSEQMQPLIQHFACITPAVIAPDLQTHAITNRGSLAIREVQAQWPWDPFHQSRMKLSIAFPDKRLLQYDCGKLQRLDKLLRQLQAGGHRALIFTQMTKVLDILEQFLNIHGHRYLRLDGATKIEQRQILTERFNHDQRILAFILSSRSGGLGINLTGADTVIFYDLDWNPAMDKQCTDRAHRIGQTRDVHIYRFVSEHTIESNILRKANQKQMLDDVVIQEGDFTTDYMNRLTYRDMLDDNAEDDAAGAAMDRVLGNEKGGVSTFEGAEDKEDIAAAKVATREVQHADDGDFEDKVIPTPDALTPGPFGATNAALAESDQDEYGVKHIDEYMLKMQLYLVKDIPLGPPKDKRNKGRRKRDEHRIRRHR